MYEPNWKVHLSRCWKDYNSYQVYLHPKSESLRIYGLISAERFYIAKYTNTLGYTGYTGYASK